MLGDWRFNANELTKTAQQLNRVMLDSDRSLDERLQAARTLSRLEPYRAAAIDQLASALSPNVPPETQQRVMQILSQSADASIPSKLSQAWKNLTPSLQTQAINVWTTRAS